MKPRFLSNGIGLRKRRNLLARRPGVPFFISGSLTVTLNEKAYKLVEGESFYFESQVGHRWINLGKTIATVLWINTPATF